MRHAAVLAPLILFLLLAASAGATCLPACGTAIAGAGQAMDAAPDGAAAPAPGERPGRKAGPGDIARLTAAGTAGDSEAQVMLGILYERGIGVPQSMISASAWYRRAALQGSADALRRAWALRRMDLPLFERAEYGSPEAQYIIGHRYLIGVDAFARDTDLARQWLTMAARLGHEGAKRDLAGLDGAGARPAP